MTCTNEEIIRLCQGMAVLLHGGVGLSEGLFLQAETETGRLRELLRQLGTELDLGASLADSMEQTGLLPEHVTGMVRIGEQTGRLEETLESLAGFYAARRRTGMQIRQAVTYPGVVLLLMLAVIGVLLVAVLPVFDSVYASLGQHLTGISAGLLYLGQLLKAALPVLLALLLLLGAVALWLRCSACARERVLGWFRRRFSDRGVFRAFNNARFAEALSMGLRSGLPLEEALDLSGRLLSDSPAAAERCRGCRSGLDDGEELAQAMGKAGFLNPAQSRMLALGLRSGSGDRVMAALSETLMEEAEGQLEQTVARIEPTMVLVSSLLVGLILLSVMLPLLNLLSAIG